MSGKSKKKGSKEFDQKKRGKNRNKDPWAIAYKKYRLSTRHIAMAKELGMNPKKFGKYSANPSEPWKTPLREFIEKCYYKRFKRKEPVSEKKKSLSTINQNE